MRLATATAADLPRYVERFDYDRNAQSRGIVHLGIGAFHRAHQAVYTDMAMSAGDRDWAITGVSLRSTRVHHALEPQDGLFTVTEAATAGERTRLVGAVRDILVATQDRAAVVRALADPGTRVVTLTVTEKGYCRQSDGKLEVDSARRPESIYSLLAAAIAERSATGAGGLSLVSCDNLANNGGALEDAMRSYLDRFSPELAAWFDGECCCPATMVDRIVPAIEREQIDTLAGKLGLRDEGAVITEPYRQWVIEDCFAGPRPRWDVAGARFVADVLPFEEAKLRMLNGAHSALAYLGLAAGHEFVHQAIADPALRLSIERLMRIEAAGTLSPALDLDLDNYADGLLARFANAALPHRLAQIANDGSQKIGPRWLVPLAINRRRGGACRDTLRALAAWIVHVRGVGTPVDDPMADRLAALWRKAGRPGIVAALFGEEGLFASAWVADPAAIAILDRHIAEAVG